MAMKRASTRATRKSDACLERLHELCVGPKFEGSSLPPQRLDMVDVDGVGVAAHPVNRGLIRRASPKSHGFIF